MKISIDVLLKAFPYKDYELYLKSASSPDFSCACVFSRDILVKESEFLYVCDAETLRETPVLPHNISIICVGRPDDLENYMYDEVNLIVLPGSYSVNKVLVETQKVFLYYNSWYERLQHAVWNSASLQEMINISESVIGYPLAVIDCAFNVLASSKFSNTNDVAWQEFQTSYLKVETMSKDSVRASDIKGGVGPVQMYSTLSKRYVMSQAIRVKGYVVGYASAHRPEPGETKFTPGEEQLLDIFTAMVVRRMQSEEFYACVSDESFSHLFLNIISQQITNKSMISERAKYIEKDLSGYKLVMMIKASQAHRVNYDKLRTRISYVFPQSTSITYHNALYVFAAQLKENYQIDQDQLFTALDGYHVSIGVSMLFSDVGQIFDHYTQAQKALQLGSLFDKEKYIYQYEDYIIYHACECFVDQLADPRAFFHSFINILRKDDREKVTQLEHTLNTYLLCDRNIMRAAQKLFVHRNTMVYRLNMITELLKSDFSDNTQRLNLLFSFAMAEYLNKINELKLGY